MKDVKMSKSFLLCFSDAKFSRFQSMGVPVPNHHKSSAVVDLSTERAITFQGFYPRIFSTKD